MRILVLGAGAIGGYFGARLSAAGVDTSFLVRPARAAVLARDGLTVRSPLSDLCLRVPTLTEAQPGFDAVILACKAYDLDSAMNAVAPAIGADTLVLPLLNGLAHCDVLAARFGSARVLGGLCHIGVTLTPSGVVEHLNAIQHFALGPLRPEQAAGARRLHAELARGGFAPVLCSDILQDMWEKFVLLAAYAGMTYLMRAPVGAIVATAQGAQLMHEMLDECAAVAAGAGHAPRPSFMAQTRAMLTEPGSPATASMLRDVQRGARTEHEHVLGDMLVRGSKMSLPLLRVAFTHLQVYEVLRSSAVSAYNAIS